ncbi:hypothetical protein BCR44DRAFT_344941 [Catenaria anguillulae PL171]|uniref:Uncharacterized protein n=1 Tax=Catenaria anguillulae PL171 TaxID=765915 RepID=A0A1Y2HDB6_9FUNG|nr:hypothetical protein BCR44DRAFT_344941 [Catenaria anguillulae PL171]
MIKSRRQVPGCTRPCTKGGLNKSAHQVWLVDCHFLCRGHVTFCCLFGGLPLFFMHLPTTLYLAFAAPLHRLPVSQRSILCPYTSMFSWFLFTACEPFNFRSFCSPSSLSLSIAASQLLETMGPMQTGDIIQQSNQFPMTVNMYAGEGTYEGA